MQEAFRMHRDTGETSCVYLAIAPNQFLEIFPNGVQPLPKPEASAIGHSHICYQVADVQACNDHLIALGIPIDTPPKVGHSKCLMLWTHDPDGNPIELMQLPPESLQVQANIRLWGTQGE